MTSILELFGEETRRALIEGDDYLIVEMLVTAKAEKNRGADSASVEYQSMCLSDNRSPWMKKKIGLLADICEETVMNFDTTIRDKVLGLLQRQDGREICLYRISVWMSLGDDGTPVWTVLDSIEPGFARINQRDVSYDTEEARQRAKSIMEEKVG
jgi:hypothetical protein